MFHSVLLIYILLESQDIQRVTNHPVHIVDEEGNLSPTALIPFCDFGNNMSALGVKIDQFSVPVCNSFKPKIVNDQLCYEMNPSIYMMNDEKANQKLQTGIMLLLSSNEDRQINPILTKLKNLKHVNANRNNSLFWVRGNKAKETIQLGTKGTIIFYNIWNEIQVFFSSLDFVSLQLGYEYNLNVLKEIDITEDFQNMDSSVKGCENNVQIQVK